VWQVARRHRLCVHQLVQAEPKLLQQRAHALGGGGGTGRRGAWSGDAGRARTLWGAAGGWVGNRAGAWLGWGDTRRGIREYYGGGEAPLGGWERLFVGGGGFGLAGGPFQQQEPGLEVIDDAGAPEWLLSKARPSQGFPPPQAHLLPLVQA
jgi:hypothetical protein